ncbi:hypothetical protein [Pararhizobium gei]|uniref:hypothetical protein n=1 Tax=Pararhizobium gei TaxID=1395951 RepID=UPI0023DB40DA|nr:hypothetical protein [Rhizobium gei]
MAMENDDRLDIVDAIDAVDDLLQALMLLITANVEKAYSGPLSAVLQEAQAHLYNARKIADP